MNDQSAPSDPWLDFIPDHVLITDLGGRVLQANGLAQKNLGLGPQVLPRPWTDLFPFHPGDPVQGSAVPRQSPFEDIFRKPSGQEIRVSVRVGPRGVDRLLWLITDLSMEQDDRQHMIDFMADLTTAQAKIREYTRQIEVFQRVVDGMKQGILLSDAGQRIVFSNAFARNLFGLDPRGKTSTDLRALLSTASQDGLGEVVEGEVLVFDEQGGRQTRCYLNVSPLSKAEPSDGNLVWSFFELTEEISNTQAFIDFSAELSDLNRRLQKKNDEIFRLSRTDVLTGVANRRAILETLESALQTAQETGQVGSVVMLDIDRFKNLNDTRGHLVGDQVIRMVALVVERVVAKTGQIGRYGGEEFLLVFPSGSADQVHPVAEAIRGAVESETLAQQIPVTVTLGVASLVPGVKMDDLLGAADAALYEGKQTGRNRVVLAPPLALPAKSLRE